MLGQYLHWHTHQGGGGGRENPEQTIDTREHRLRDNHVYSSFEHKQQKIKINKKPKTKQQEERTPRRLTFKCKIERKNSYYVS